MSSQRLFFILPMVCAIACVKATETRPASSNAPAQLSAFFDEVYQRQLADDPVRQAYLGLNDRNDEWTDESEAARRARLDADMASLDVMRERFELSDLGPQDQLSYRLFAYQIEQRAAAWPYRDHRYPVNQMRGFHTQLPSFLINMHPIDDGEDARAYVARLRGVEVRFQTLMTDLKQAEAAGAIPPSFVHPRVLEDCQNILRGSPFDDSGTDSAILRDFRTKVEALDLDTVEHAALIRDAESALLEGVEPAYRALMAFIEDQQGRATTDDGVWKFPDGEAYYAHRLRHITTTSMTAEEIHALGLEEVARIHDEMRLIRDAVGFEGDLQAFFKHLNEDPQFTYPNTDEGRSDYLARATQIIETMDDRLDELFHTRPQSPMVVKRVEAWRERSAGKAFYQRGSPDGTRPGIYYANLYNMEDMPRYQMEALAYHEGIPGHHMQNSIAMELQGVPEFRKQSHVTAYGEGWGLYTEYLPKEMGLYADPFSDFGRLAMELWRACRLVVDTGIHHKKWTREDAIAYLEENTPNPNGDIVKAIERYIVMPGQATAYKVGMLRLLSLRKDAKDALGDDFEIRDFHDVVLLNGPMPLEILEEEVVRYYTQAD
jgi:uncharacterized protein (DUF885 family)